MIRIINSSSRECSEYTDKLDSRRRKVPEQILKKVSDIIEKVREKGNEAVLDYTLRFDGVRMDAGMIRVDDREIRNACAVVEPDLLRAIKKAAYNIREFHKRQRQESWFYTGEKGEILGQRLSAIQRVGLYVPGGTAPLVSSVLMNAIPAKVAGVDRIIMATPPQGDGSVNPAILAAANEAGVDEVYRMGGAQAIAALAYGTETIPWVHKIVGPGNIYVAMAKKMVYGTVDIDMIAGPSEIAIIADESATPSYIAADMLSQAEHDEMAAAVLLTGSKGVAEEVKAEIDIQLECLDRKEIAKASLREYGSIIVTSCINEAVDIANAIAPEHLELCVKEPFKLLGAVRNAGAVFLGNSSPEPVGDYMAGPNHVLPTGGTACFFSPLGVYDFIKRTGVVYYTPEALSSVTKDIIRLAEAEGLSAHANSIRIRSEEDTV